MKTIRRHDRTGSAMLLALIAFLFIAGIGSAIFSLSLSEQRTTMAAASADSAYHITEAGIDDAINKIRAYIDDPINTTADYAVIGVTTKDASGNDVNEVTGSIRGGSYIVTIEPPFDTAKVQEYTLTSVGTLGAESRGLTTILTASEVESSFRFGLFGDLSVDTVGNSMTDGYFSVDPETGAKLSYLDQNKNFFNGKAVANKTGSIGSNKKVTVGANTTIYGNANSGPGFSTGASSSNVAGNQISLKETMDLVPPPLTPPTDPAPTAMGAITSGTLGMAGQDTVITADSLVASAKGGGVTIQGNVALYVSGPIKWTATAPLTLASGATLKIYQDTSTDTKAALDIHGSASLNSSGSPAALQINSNAATANLTGDADFYGTINAPATAVKFNLGSAAKKNYGVFGSVIAKTITVIGGADFHYDESLAAVKQKKIKVDVKSVEPFVPGKVVSY